MTNDTLEDLIVDHIDEYIDMIHEHIKYSVSILEDGG